MFLATTADERYWKVDEPILFLGEWCKRYRRREFWGKLDHRTLAYHWDDRQRLRRDYDYLRGVYERQLKALAGRLNEIHGSDHSERYWRILVGPWLSQFIEVVFDRRASIASALAAEPDLHTYTSAARDADWIPRDFAQFLQWCSGDDYNLHLYSRIVEREKTLPHRALEFPLPPGRPAVRQPLLKRALNALGGSVPDALNRVVFVSSYLSRSQQFRVQSALGQWPWMVFEPALDVEVSPDFGKRSKLASGAGVDAFEELLGELLPRQLPMAYLENYAEVRHRALALYPRRPGAIFTANAYATQELFKAWSAEKSEEGVPLCIAQHGGHHGTGAWSSYEEHELQIADRYYTWGWDRPGAPQCRPLTPGPLIRARESITYPGEGGVLWVPMSLPRYSYWMYSVPVGPQMLSYLEEQRRLYEALGPQARALTTLRLFPHELGWDEDERWKEWAPDLRLYRGPLSFAGQLSRNRLLLGTYNSTTFLETFVANFPTVLFWNPSQWELRPEAVPYFDALRRASILHDTPESAAEKVNAVCGDPMSWWRRPDVQAARSQFCGRFAHVANDWVAEWKAEFPPDKGWRH